MCARDCAISSVCSGGQSENLRLAAAALRTCSTGVFPPSMDLFRFTGRTPAGRGTCRGAAGGSVTSTTSAGVGLGGRALSAPRCAAKKAGETWKGDGGSWKCICHCQYKPNSLDQGSATLSSSWPRRREVNVGLGQTGNKYVCVCGGMLTHA
ncbi:unnamed protein product [Ixodes persulcatus]